MRHAAFVRLVPLLHSTDGMFVWRNTCLWEDFNFRETFVTDNLTAAPLCRLICFVMMRLYLFYYRSNWQSELRTCCAVRDCAMHS